MAAINDVKKQDFDPVPLQDTFQTLLVVTLGGLPVDWTMGYSLEGQIRLDPSDAVPVAAFTFTPNASVPATGQSVMYMDTGLLAVPVGAYVYSVRLNGPSGYIKTVMAGEFKVTYSPTTH